MHTFIAIPVPFICRCSDDPDSDPGWYWPDALSPGELQRLAFVRLLYRRPSLALLDEATSALSSDVEEKLYSACLAAGVTVVSVGHREGLKKFHDVLVTLGTDGEGGWTVEDIVH